MKTFCVFSPLKVLIEIAKNGDFLEEYRLLWALFFFALPSTKTFLSKAVRRKKGLIKSCIPRNKQFFLHFSLFRNEENALLILWWTFFSRTVIGKLFSTEYSANKHRSNLVYYIGKIWWFFSIFSDFLWFLAFLKSCGERSGGEVARRLLEMLWDALVGCFWSRNEVV